MLQGRFLVLIVFSIFSFNTQGADKPPTLHEWAEASNDDSWVKKIIGKAGYQLSDALFGVLEDLKITSIDLGDDGGNIELSVGRKVFDNHDVNNSWTVADTFRVAGKMPIYGQEVELGAGGPTIGFSFGTKAGIEFINLRQVTPTQYKTLPDLEDEKKKLQESSWYKEFVEGKSSDDPREGGWIRQAGDMVAGSPDRLTFQPELINPEDIGQGAQLSKFWNMFLFPFKLPLKPEAVKKMEQAEIISYAGDGTLELGASVGWSLDPSGITDIVQGKISVTTYVRGNFRITVMKESNRYVKVKVTRLFEKGVSAGANAELKLVPFDGFILAKQLAGQLKFVPFDFKISFHQAREFDVGYRYDLENAEAREAFQKAVFGRLALSEQLSTKADGKPLSGTGVEKVFTRKTSSSGSGVNRKMKLGFFYKNDQSSTVTNIDTVITTPEGESKIFKALIENQKSWKALWVAYERYVYRFAVNIDLTQYEKDPNCITCFNLVGEGEINDGISTRGEAMKYMLQVEDSVGKFGIFPRPPKQSAMTLAEAESIEQADSGAISLPLKNLGESRFYYRVGITNAQIRKFIETSDDTKWQLLEHAFGVHKGAWSSSLNRFLWSVLRAPLTALNIPLYVSNFAFREGESLSHALKIKKKWDKLEGIYNPRKQAESLGRLFSDRLFSYELMKLLRSSLAGEEAQYVASGRTKFFGEIVDSGLSELKFDDMASDKQKQIDFDKPGSQIPPGGEDTKVYELSFTSIDKDHANIKFALQAVPHAIDIQLYSDEKSLWGKKKLAEVLLYNDGTLKSGSVTLNLDRTKTEDPLTAIMDKLVDKGRYKIRVSMNPDGIRWGETAEQEFKIK